MAISNRICFVDGTKYSYCPSCFKDRYKPSWYSMFCCERCKTVFETVENYCFGRINKDEARAILLTLDLSDSEKFDAGTRDKIAEILKVNEVQSVIEEPERQVQVDAAESVQEIVPQKYTSKKKKFNRKKRNKNNSEVD